MHKAFGDWPSKPAERRPDNAHRSAGQARYAEHSHAKSDVDNKYKGTTDAQSSALGNSATLQQWKLSRNASAMMLAWDELHANCKLGPNGHAGTAHRPVPQDRELELARDSRTRTPVRSRSALLLGPGDSEKARPGGANAGSTCWARPPLIGLTMLERRGTAP